MAAKQRKTLWIVLLVGILLGTLSTYITVFHKTRAGDKNKFKSQKAQIKATSDLEVASFVTPHHLVAKKLIDEIFQTVSGKNDANNIDRIILVSPNHSSLGSAPILVSNKNWVIGDKEIVADADVVAELEKFPKISLDNEAFANEHGIGNILPYISKYYPEKRIVNIIFKEGIKQEELDGLAMFMTENISGNSLMILSSDFSHQLEKNISGMHDAYAARVMNNFELENISNVDSDCQSGLYLLMKYSSLLGFEKFKAVGNSNSSEIYGKNFIGGNTSYVTGYFSKESEADRDSSAFMFFVGDLMLDRYNLQLITKNGSGWFTKKIGNLFRSYDYGVANLEGVISNNESLYNSDSLWDESILRFTFDPESSIRLLKDNGFNMLNLGNNHIDDFEMDGLEQTVANLDRNKIGYFGDLSGKDLNGKIIEKSGKKIGFVSYNEFGGQNAAQIRERISQLNDKVDFLIVYTHWGKEYELKENEVQRQKAHDFIDAGVDVVIGSHPHVVQPVEIYKDKAIFYSLGNFIFDQYFSEDTKTMLALGLFVSDKTIGFNLIPLYLSPNGQLILADESKRKNLLDRTAGDVSIDKNIKKAISDGYFELDLRNEF